MANTQAESPQQIMLNRLLQTEKEVQARRLQAQQQRDQMQAESAAQIKQLLESARANANAEVAIRKRQMQAELDAKRQELAAATQSQIEAIQRTAQRRMDAAVAFLVDWVTGKATQL